MFDQFQNCFKIVSYLKPLVYAKKGKYNEHFILIMEWRGGVKKLCYINFSIVIIRKVWSGNVRLFQRNQNTIHEKTFITVVESIKRMQRESTALPSFCIATSLMEKN